MSKAAELDGCWSIERSDSLTISLDFEHDEQMEPALELLREIREIGERSGDENILRPRKINDLSILKELKFGVEDTDYNRCWGICSDGINKETGERWRHILAKINKEDLPKLIKALQEVEGE